MNESKRKSLLLSLVALIGIGGGVGAVTFNKPQQVNAGFFAGDAIQAIQDLHTELSETTSKASSVKADVEYALPWVEILGTNGAPILIDMNGDGLTDALFSDKMSSEMLQYVLLNNGNGFEVAYSCYYSNDYDTVYTYRGTCADL